MNFKYCNSNLALVKSKLFPSHSESNDFKSNIFFCFKKSSIVTFNLKGKPFSTLLPLAAKKDGIEIGFSICFYLFFLNGKNLFMDK